MAVCPNCGAVILPSEAFCTNCGAPAPTDSVPGGNTPPQNNYQQNYQQTPDWTPPSYQQPMYSQPVISGSAETVGVGDWFVTLLLCMIPIVNIVMLCVWAFGSSAPQSKSNWAKAQLIWMVVSIVLSILLVIVFGVSFATIMNSASRY